MKIPVYVYVSTTPLDGVEPVGVGELDLSAEVDPTTGYVTLTPDTTGALTGVRDALNVYINAT